MRKLICLLLLLASLNSFSQFIKDINGRPYLTTNYEEYEGTPFHFQNWVKADVTTASGTVYKSMLVNIDEYKNEALFSREGKTYTFVDDVISLTVMNEYGKQIFTRGRMIDTSLPDVFFEIINEKPLLIKSNAHPLVEVPNYGEAHKHYRFNDLNGFYTQLNGTLQKLTLNKSNAEKLFAAKWNNVDSYANQNKISFKTEDGWKLLMLYYISL